MHRSQVTAYTLMLCAMIALFYLHSTIDNKSVRLVSVEPKQTYTICTYFVPLGLDEEDDNKTREMVEIWRESWSKQGWETKILTEEDAKMHPQYQKIKDTLLKLPTVNTIEYELSCYLRWVAAIAAGCKWMSDVDMVNYGFPPQDHWRGSKLYSFEGHTPSLVTGNTKAFESILKIFLKVAEDPTGPEISLYQGRKHTSDMIILSEHHDDFVDLEYPANVRHQNPSVNDSVLLHFSSSDTHKYTGGKLSKAQLARNFRKKSN